jgi:hypothetical protein
MTLPQFQQHRQERREMRYPLHLPVLIKMAREEMHARSENISLGGILLSSPFLIPEGTMVEVAVGVKNTLDPGILLSARGKVLRAQPKHTGDFAVAIRLERAFQLPLRGREPQRVTIARAVQSPDREKARPVFYRAPYVTAWHTET